MIAANFCKTLICKLCKYLHESLHHKDAEANNCNSFKYILQGLQTKFAAVKICIANCTLDANICCVPTYRKSVKLLSLTKVVTFLS